MNNITDITILIAVIALAMCRESNILLSLHETESYKSNRTSMNRTLHEADNAQRILKLTADTMLLVDRNGNIVGDPLLGGIDNQNNYDALMKQIQSVIDADSSTK